MVRELYHLPAEHVLHVHVAQDTVLENATTFSNCKQLSQILRLILKEIILHVPKYFTDLTI